MRDDLGRTFEPGEPAIPAKGVASAVTISVAKRPGANATMVAEAALERVAAAKGAARSGRRRHRDDAQLRRDRGREGRRTDPAHPHRDTFRHRSDLVLPGLARGPSWCWSRCPSRWLSRCSCTTRWGISLNRNHPLRADLLHRHPGRRRDRGRGEQLYRHLAMGRRRPEEAAVEGVDEVGKSHHPRDHRGDRRHPADGLSSRE